MTQETTTMQIRTNSELEQLRPIVGGRLLHEMRRHLHHGDQLWFIPDEATLDQADELNDGERAYCRSRFAEGARWVWVFRASETSPTG